VSSANAARRPSSRRFVPLVISVDALPSVVRGQGVHERLEKHEWVSGRRDGSESGRRGEQVLPGCYHKLADKLRMWRVRRSSTLSWIVLGEFLIILWNSGMSRGVNPLTVRMWSPDSN